MLIATCHLLLLPQDTTHRYAIGVNKMLRLGALWHRVEKAAWRAKGNGKMHDVNPYAAPLDASVLNAEIIGSKSGIWRDGNKLVMYKGARLPDRCVHCNAPANGRRLNRTLYWHHPLIYLVVLAGVLVYVIVALVVRKKAVVAIGMCDRHYTRRLRSMLLWWLITAASGALFWYGVRVNSPMAGWAILTAVSVFFGNLFFAVAITRPVAPARIDDYYVWLRKIHPDYLAEFPPLPT
jgi:hypothetical protein